MTVSNLSYPPLTQNIIDSETGELTPAWNNFFRSLNSILGSNFGNTGVSIPTLDSVDSIAEPTNGVMIYSNAESSFKVYEDGSWKTMDTT